MQPIADANHVKESDYFGVVSASFVADKFEKSGLTATKSKLVDAPIINEFPICMECEFIEYQYKTREEFAIAEVFANSYSEIRYKIYYNYLTPEKLKSLLEQENKKFYHLPLDQQHKALLKELNSYGFDFKENDLGVDKLRTLYYGKKMYSKNQNG